MELFVYSRAAIERLPPHDVPHLIISITTTPHDTARLPASRHCRGILRLAFPDADQAAHGYADADLFSTIQADQVWELVLVHRADVVRVVLHCDAGISRSPAVAAALSKILVGDDSEFFTRYRPNMRVYRTLLDRYYDHFAGRSEAR